MTLEKIDALKYILKKHHLTPGSAGNDITLVARDICGLHATITKSSYISAYVRMQSFRNEMLEDALYGKISLGKIRCVRKTVHILPREMIRPSFSATKEIILPRKSQYLKIVKATEEEFDAAAEDIMKALSGRALSTKEIKKEVDTALSVSFIVNLLCDQGRIIRWKPAGGWNSTNHTYRITKEVFSKLDMGGMDTAAAQAELIRRYIGAYGPVTANDVFWWTGLKKTSARNALSALEKELEYMEIDGLNGEHIMLSSDMKEMGKATMPEENTINLLPALDPYIMGYKNRERYMQSEWYHNIFDRSGNGISSIFQNGRIVGVWDVEERKKAE